MPKDWLSYIWGLNVEQMEDVTEHDLISERLQSIHIEDGLEMESVVN